MKYCYVQKKKTGWSKKKNIIVLTLKIIQLNNIEISWHLPAFLSLTYQTVFILNCCGLVQFLHKIPA